MAGTEETKETENANVDASPSSDDGVHSDRVERRGPIDDNIRTLTISELHNRVHVGRLWRTQGMICVSDPLHIVRAACHEFLETTAKEYEALATTPYVQKKKPCADCKGVDLHKPTCPTMRR